MDIVLIIIYAILLVYVLLLIGFFIGWIRIPPYHPVSVDLLPKISLLIACRNEEKNLHELFTALRAQDFPPEQWEVIWIDDHSIDHTRKLVEEFGQNRYHSVGIKLPDTQSGKKEALRFGLSHAKGELIVLTDADCLPCPTWLSTLASFYHTSGADLMLGPVQLNPATSPWQQMVKLEFMSLMASSAGATGMGSPIMAHGPNMAIPANLYRTYKDQMDERFASGDDVFLLQAMKRDGKKISFIKSREAMVESSPPKGIRGFVKQRQRWASKAKGYHDPMMIITTLLVFFVALSLMVTLVAGITDLLPWRHLWILLLIKTAAELPLMISALRFYQFREGIGWFFAFQPIYFLYVFCVGLASMSGTYSWKGRRVK